MKGFLSSFEGKYHSHEMIYLSQVYDMCSHITKKGKGNITQSFRRQAEHCAALYRVH